MNFLVLHFPAKYSAAFIKYAIKLLNLLNSNRTQFIGYSRSFMALCVQMSG